jgi:NAD(P)-dependent dehydrogenase (short-subunit alcohol dehydrogenase family)
MVKDLKGCVLVSGASTGIGKAVAVRLAQENYKVFAGVRTDRAARDLGCIEYDILEPVFLDVTKSSEIKNVMEKVSSYIKTSHVQFSGVINNAGICLGTPLEMTSVNDFRKVFDVNVMGTLALTQAFLPLLKESFGRIVIIGSSAGYFCVPLMGAYSASKHALEALTDILRLEMKQFGVNVCLVEPGTIKTPIWQKTIEESLEQIAIAPNNLQRDYSSLYKCMLDFAKKEVSHGSSPEVVAKVVLQAISSKRPKTRYRVGKNALMEKLLSRFPDRVRDWAILRFINYY